MKPIVKNFDLSRYAGTWYEMAHSPLVYQKGCQNARAEYTLDDKGMRIKNVCISEGNDVFERTGLAWLPKGKKEGKLKLKFDPSPVQGDWGTSDYWVHWTDYDNYSVVGGPHGIAYILSRKKIIPKEDLKIFGNYLRKIGYDTSKMIIDRDVIKNEI